MESPIGYYPQDSDDAVCSDCSDPFTEEDDTPIWSWSESDTPTHCSECGDLIWHALTDDGIAYVAASITECLNDGIRNPVTHMWADHYGDKGVDRLITDEQFEAFFNLPLFRHKAFAQQIALIGEEES